MGDVGVRERARRGVTVGVREGWFLHVKEFWDGR